MEIMNKSREPFWNTPAVEGKLNYESRQKIKKTVIESAEKFGNRIRGDSPLLRQGEQSLYKKKGKIVDDDRWEGNWNMAADLGEYKALFPIPAVKKPDIFFWNEDRKIVILVELTVQLPKITRKVCFCSIGSNIFGKDCRFKFVMFNAPIIKYLGYNSLKKGKFLVD